MKYLLAALSGFALTLFVFVGGAAFAITYLTAEPVQAEKSGSDAAVVWTTEAVKVDTTRNHTQRVESQPALTSDRQEKATVPEADVDRAQTASIVEPQTSEPMTLDDEHVSWCADHYRSYRPEDNSYTSFRGDVRECVSPFSDQNLAEPASNASLEQANYIEASSNGAGIGDMVTAASTGNYGAEHAEYCFSLYRSYRPEDNTYQPYGGGPRRQCQ